MLELVSIADDGPVSLADAKAHLRVDHADDDALITNLIAVAEGHLSGRNGTLNRMMREHVFKLHLLRWTDAIDLRVPPVRSIESFVVRDWDGVETAVSTDLWRLETAGPVAQVLLKPGLAWPDIPSGGRAIIEFTSGYADAASTPMELRHAMLLLIGHWYANREAVGAVGQTVPLAVDSLTAPYRDWITG